MSKNSSLILLFTGILFLGGLSLAFVFFQIHGQDGAKYPRFIKWSPVISQQKTYEFIFKRHFGLIQNKKLKSLCFESIGEQEQRNIQLAFIQYFPLAHSNCEPLAEKILFKNISTNQNLKKSCPSSGQSISYLILKTSIKKENIMSTPEISKYYPLSLEKRSQKLKDSSRFYSMVQVTSNCYLIPMVNLKSPT